MGWRLSTALLCAFAISGETYAQDVMIMREAKPKVVQEPAAAAEKAKPDIHIEKAIAVHPAKPPVPKEAAPAQAAGIEIRKAEAAPRSPSAPVQKPAAVATTTVQKPAPAVATAQNQKPTAAPETAQIQKPAPPALLKAPVQKPAAVASTIVQKPAPAVASAESQKPPAAPETAQVKKPAPPASSKTPTQKTEIVSRSPNAQDLFSRPQPAQVKKPEPAFRPANAAVQKPISAALVSVQNSKPEPASRPANPPLRMEVPDVAQFVNEHMETAFTKLADGFDFPIGKPDAQGYYKARGFRSRGHLGEDWDGIRGGDTDLGDPIYSIGDGLVVFARDCHMGWGNVIIVRHTYSEGGVIKNIDALYGHLNNMAVRRGQAVTRGQKIATMGNAHGLYDAHLHLEIRKNIEIGMSRAAFARDFSNYYDPSLFIASHRHLQVSTGKYRVAMNTFTRDANINWNKARNYSRSHERGTSDSAAALKKAVARSSVK